MHSLPGSIAWHEFDHGAGGIEIWTMFDGAKMVLLPTRMRELGISENDLRRRSGQRPSTLMAFDA